MHIADNWHDTHPPFAVVLFLQGLPGAIEVTASARSLFLSDENRRAGHGTHLRQWSPVLFTDHVKFATRLARAAAVNILQAGGMDQLSTPTRVSIGSVCFGSMFDTRVLPRSVNVTHSTEVGPG